MPLVQLCGFPASGKTTRTQELSDYFEGHCQKTVKVISDHNSGVNRNEVYADSKKEKTVRGNLKSAVQRDLNKDSITILDSLNYIKGFRYELYCVSKECQTTQCVIFCNTNKEVAAQWNASREPGEQYTPEILDALIMRFEEPRSSNRWDSPLFVIQKDDTLPFEQINDALLRRKAPPQNASTLPQPPSSTNFLYELDRITKEVLAVVMETQKMSMPGDPVPISRATDKQPLSSTNFLCELERITKEILAVVMVTQKMSMPGDQVPIPRANDKQPLSSTNFLYELDRITKEILAVVMEAQKMSVPGDQVPIPGATDKIILSRTFTLAELQRNRRQFITYTKMHPVDDPGKLANMFVQYLNNTLK